MAVVSHRMRGSEIWPQSSGDCERIKNAAIIAPNVMVTVARTTTTVSTARELRSRSRATVSAAGPIFNYYDAPAEIGTTSGPFSTRLGSTLCCNRVHVQLFAFSTACPGTRVFRDVPGVMWNARSNVSRREIAGWFPQSRKGGMDFCSSPRQPLRYRLSAWIPAGSRN